MFFLLPNEVIVSAENENEESEINIGELIDNLDLSGLDAYLSEMSDEYSSVIGESAGEYIKSLAAGEKNFSVNDVISIFVSSFKTDGNIIPMVSSLVAICIIWSLIGGVEFKNNSISAKKSSKFRLFKYYVCHSTLLDLCLGIDCGKISRRFKRTVRRGFSRVFHFTGVKRSKRKCKRIISRRCYNFGNALYAYKNNSVSDCNSDARIVGCRKYIRRYAVKFAP